MKILIFLGLLLIFVVSAQSAQAIQTLEQKELPQLKSLHYCQDSEGVVKAQNEECESGKTEVSSITKIRNGKVIHAPLGETLATWNPEAKAPKSVASQDASAPTSDARLQSTEGSVLTCVQKRLG